MLKSQMLLSSSLVSFNRKADNEEGADKVIDKAVYLRPDETLKDVVLHVTNTADAILRLIASMTVHAIVRSYSPVIADRAKWEVTKDELVGTIREHAAMKRGYDFKRAWIFQLLKIAGKVCQSLMKDYDVKGVRDGSPLQKVLRSKTTNAAAELVVEYITAKTKGATSFAALERVYNPPVTNPGTGNRQSNNSGKRGNTGKTGNAVKAATIAAQLTGDKATAAFNAVEAKNPVARAKKIVDKIASANVDHFTMAARFIALMDDEEKLMQLAQLATDRAKELHAKANPKPRATKPEPAAAAG